MGLVFYHVIRSSNYLRSEADGSNPIEFETNFLLYLLDDYWTSKACFLLSIRSHLRARTSYNFSDRIISTCLSKIMLIDFIGICNKLTLAGGKARI